MYNTIQLADSWFVYGLKFDISLLQSSIDSVTKVSGLDTHTSSRNI